MTTATKSKPTASSELRKLQADRDKLHARVREARRRIEAFDAETEAKRFELAERHRTNPEEFIGAERRIKPDTPAAKLRSEIQERMHSPNPHQAEFDQAFGPYEEADLALQRFKRERVLDRIAEVTADVDADGLREGFQQVRTALETYRVAVEEVKGIILDTPGLDGQALAYDGQIDGFYDHALSALDSLEGGISKPGLSPLAAYKVGQRV